MLEGRNPALEVLDPIANIETVTQQVADLNDGLRDTDELGGQSGLGLELTSVQPDDPLLDGIESRIGPLELVTNLTQHREGRIGLGRHSS